MVVVPTFTKGNYCQQWIVTTVITRLETPTAKKVRHRVHGVSGMVKQHRRNAEAPDEELHATRTRNQPNESLTHDVTDYSK